MCPLISFFIPSVKEIEFTQLRLDPGHSMLGELYLKMLTCLTSSKHG